MICLTGDLHHASLGTGNQKACDITEIQVAQRYMQLLRDAGVKVTFFVTGRAVAEEERDLRVITDDPLVEVGGHGYTCFEPALAHRVWNKVTGSYNGPRWYQRWDTQRTIDIVRRRLGHRIRAWRNHMYMHGPHTDEVLHACGIDICSDGVDRFCRAPRRHRSGIASFPINIIPDHEHLYHAERTPRAVERWIRRYGFRDDFGARSYYIHEWTDLVLEQLQDNEQRGAISNMIIHPITMYLCDGFAGFERILAFIAGCESVHMSAAYEQLCARETEGSDDD